MIVHLNGQFLPKAEALISPDDRGFLFADGAYEVVRFYQGRLFEAEAHWLRFNRSLRELHISKPEALDYERLCRELITQNGMQQTDGYIYLQITRGAAPRNHAFPKSLPATVYAYATELVRDRERQAGGVKAIFYPDLRWARCDIKAVSLLPNVLATHMAGEAGVDEALLVREGFVTESSRANIAIVKNGVMSTHPLSERILGGITRLVVLRLCEAEQIPVREETFTEQDLLTAEEVFLMGTTVEVLPVIEVNGHPINGRQPGEITRKLQVAFQTSVEQCMACR